MHPKRRTSGPGKNRLGSESSPYLLQHADNPVDWFPWGEEAFDKARREDRPIFLSIGYSTCYWCHVMERESFDDPEVADRMNRTVVAVKVDREERPDLDGIYMTAVMLLTGSGGWPMSAFLTPDRKPFFGATYIPKDRFLDLLDAVASAWTKRREQVMEEADRVADAIRSASGLPGKPSGSLPGPDRINAAARQYGEMFDAANGGFGGAPKFPQPAILELLMSEYERTNDPAVLSMVTRTLDAMARGGIHDQVGGGFHRYSTDAAWRIPHFEKMLYDQAQLLHAYARGFRLTGRTEYRRICEQIARYVEREMTGAEGLFFSAQDSEVDAEEGKPYLWTRKELEEALDPAEAALAVRAYGIGAAPPFEGRHILFWPTPYAAVAEASGKTVPELFAGIDRIRSKLLTVRLSRPRPFLDDKAIAGWNGLMIEALAYAGSVLGETRMLAQSSRAADGLLARLRDENGRLLHVARGGAARLPAYLDDYGAAILGLVALARGTGEDRWGVEAERLGRILVGTFRDPSGRFRYADPSVGFLIAETRDLSDGAFPSGNSLALRALVGLAATGHPEYAGTAAGVLRSFSPLLSEHPAALPYMLWGLHEFHAQTIDRTASGPPGRELPETREILAVEGSLSRDRVAPGNPLEVRVVLTMKKGWHINANPASMDTLVPTTLDAKVKGRKSTFVPRYPRGTPVSLGPGKETITVYENRVVLSGTLRIEEDGGEAAKGTVVLSVLAQGCDAAGRCLSPSTVEEELSFSYE
ncbi:MAG: thioredoxin domain-containing protein [Deltaproteobacteria bacterium]